MAMTIDPELAMPAMPFTLSIEPVNRPTFLHGYHLGTDESVARSFAIEIFDRHQKNPEGTGLYTVALMKGTQVFDVWDGRDWFSNDMDKLMDDEHGRQQVMDAQAVHGTLSDVSPIKVNYGKADEPNIDLGELIREVAREADISIAWARIEQDNEEWVAEHGPFAISRTATLWDAVSRPVEERRALAAALARGSVLFY